MDETQTNRKSSSTMRKRRSSILKSQRPSRAPLSELEFHVATPTDTTKSRRVSFSRRTGVAEFVTNEATTTWKTFYEEHNKSLESSNNESEANQRRIDEHLGKRALNNQFQEIANVNFVSTQDRPRNRHINISNDIDQLASPERTGDDRQPVAPEWNFELSSFTENHSKMFTNDNANPMMVEMTDHLDINFSSVTQPNKNLLDDLDEIQRDVLENLANEENEGCLGPFKERGNISQYIEVDLNMTHVTIANEESDMSITDTISSPKVQSSQPNISLKPEIAALKSTNWVVDKENILINPYVAPPETDNFAINESSDKVLVFDGKRLILQCEKKNLNSVMDDNTENQIYSSNCSSSLANISKNMSFHRKSMVFNDDDLPNFIEDVNELKTNVDSQKSDATIVERRRTVIYDDGDLSMTQAVNNVEMISHKEHTVFYQSNDQDISLTMAAPDPDVNLTNCKSEGYMSLTQAVECNEILNSNEHHLVEEKDCDISLTQAVPANIIINEIIHNTEKRKTIVFDNDDGNISITQVVPSNIIPAQAMGNSEKNKTVLYEKQSDISMTEVLPSNIIINNFAHTKENVTIMYNNDHDMSITQAVPTFDVNKNSSENINKDCTITNNTLNNNKVEEIAITENNETVDLSFTRTIPNNIIENGTNQLRSEKRKTVVFDNDAGDVSLTEALTGNVIIQSCHKEEKRQSLSQPVNMSTTETMSNNIIHQINNTLGRNNDEFVTDMSMTRPVPPQINKHSPKKVPTAYEKTCSLSLTKPIPISLKTIQKDLVDCINTTSKLSYMLPDQSYTNDIIVYQASDTLNVEIQQHKDSSTLNVELQEQKYSSTSHKSFGVNTLKSVCTIGTQEDLNDIEDQPDKSKQNISYKLYSQDNSLSSNNNLLSEVKPRNSILNNLLDMSNASVTDGIDDKNTMTKMESNNELSDIHKDDLNGTSKESLFYIIRDSKEDVQADRCEKLSNYENVSSHMRIQHEPRKSLTFADDVLEIEDETFLPEFKNNSKHNVESSFVKHKKILSPKKILHNEEENSDLGINSKEIYKNSANSSSSYIKDCDTTQELLDMLTQFTDIKSSKTSIAKDDAKINETQDFVVEKNYDTNDHISTIPKRKSVVFSREELAQNFSMAQALLQKSRMEMDESETEDAPPDISLEQKIPNKSIHLNTDVVKTLIFEDESTSEVNKSELHNKNPVKKTVFNETSNCIESKAKVIPSYLSDVTENIKDLMRDLVKPMADVLPFDSSGLQKTGTCKCTTEIQADLITSSQVDLDVDRLSSTGSYDFDKLSRSTKALNISRPSALPISSEENDRSKNYTQHVHEIGEKRVICFDPENPLNNVLLMPIDHCQGHRYNPQSATNSKTSSHSDILMKNEDKISEERIPPSFEVENVHSITHNSSNSVKTDLSKSMSSNLSKRSSVDRGVEVRCIDVKTVDCNTLIAMKENHELLDASSSLTLVDDALNQKGIADNLCSRLIICQDVSSQTTNNSQLKVILKNNKQNSPIPTDMELDNDDKENSSRKKSKAKKRSYSPTAQGRNMDTSSVDVTPKPVSKITKLTNRRTFKTDEKTNHNEQKKLRDSHPVIELSDDEATRTSPENTKNSPKKKSKSILKDKPCTSLTVQHLITEFKMKENIDVNLNMEVLKSLDDVLSKKEMASSNSESTTPELSSCVSSKNQSEMELQRSAGACPGNQEVAESVPRPIVDCQGSVNVVAKIDMLPFMGTSECEWESSSGDWWSFRLLHGRIRLRVHLAHRHDNAPRTRVRADTPVLAFHVDIVQQDKNPVGRLCVRYASETMRVCAARGGAGGPRAADALRVVRACAAAARLAARWGRAMGEARLQLAYKLNDDGEVTLTVANIPLRSVWEVSLRIALEVPAAPGAPWPRARDVLVAPVVARACPAPPALAALLAPLPHDWGHAPRVIWKIFRYLKNKTREEDDLFAL